MRSPSDDLASYIASLGVGAIGSSSGWSINIGMMPDAPSTCISIRDNGGGITQTDELDVHSPVIQVMVRGVDYRSTYNKIDEVTLALHGFMNMVMGDARYLSATAITDVMPLGTNAKGAYLMMRSFRVIRQQN